MIYTVSKKIDIISLVDMENTLLDSKLYEDDSASVTDIGGIVGCMDLEIVYLCEGYDALVLIILRKRFII